jgi:hypothetical protein
MVKRLFSNLVLSMVLNAIDFPEKEFMRKEHSFIPLQIIFIPESSREKQGL